MEFVLEGAGSGNKQEVTDAKQALILAESHSVQMHHSRKNGQAYQVEGFHTITSAGTKTILTIKNKSPSLVLAITSLQFQVAGLVTAGTTMPAPATRFEYGDNAQRDSGGGVVTAMNTNTKSGNSAVVEAFDDNPTMENTFSRFETWWVEANGVEHRHDKGGSIIVGLNDSFTIQLVTDFTDGAARCSIWFVMLPPKPIK